MKAEKSKGIVVQSPKRMLLLLCAICYNNNYGGSGKKILEMNDICHSFLKSFPATAMTRFLRHNFVSMLPSVINMSHFDYNCRWVNKIMKKKGEKRLKLIVTFPLSKTSKSQKMVLEWTKLG